MKQLIHYPKGKTASSYVVPNGVTTIDAWAFYNCKNLTSLSLPEGVTTINNNAFSACTNLASIAFPDSLISISSRVFETFNEYSGPTQGTAWFNNQPNGMVYASTVAYCWKGPVPENTNIVIKDGTKGMAYGALEADFITGVTIPASVISINNLVFHPGSSYGVTFYGYRGSYAEEYAAIKSIPFIAIDPYTITYHANGGTGAPPSQQTELDKVFTLSTVVPTRSGYTFIGWAESVTATAPTVYPGDQLIQVAANNVTLYAVWKENNNTLVYDANGGTEAPPSQQVPPGEITLSDIIPIRTGYTFLGWSENQNATIPTTEAGQSINITGTGGRTVTLYAIWQTNTYSVKYNANGGSGTMANIVHTYDIARNLTANAFTRTGYLFIGWATSNSRIVAYDDQASATNLTFTNGAVVELYAVWEEIMPTTYVVTMDDIAVDMFYAAGEIVTITASTAPIGQRFKEWNISPNVTFANGTDKTSDTAMFTMPSQAIIVAAVYENIPPATYIVTLNPNGGSVSPTTISVTNGGTYSTLPTPTRSGYTFNGWYTEATGGTKVNPSDTVNLTGNITLYAQWTQNTTPPPPIKYIFTTKYEATFINWILFFLLFGFIWMWF